MLFTVSWNDPVFILSLLCLLCDFMRCRAESFTVRHFGVNAQGMKDGEIDELTSFLEKWAVSPAIVPESPEVEVKK